MKKIIYIILSLSLLVTSCNLDKKKAGTIDTGMAVESLQDAANVRNYLYLRLRGMSAGSPIYFNELSADTFHGSIAFGNRGGTTYRWEWLSTESIAESLWSYNYYTTAIANFLLEKMEGLDQSAMSDIQKDSLNTFKGECYFFKALTMFDLAQRFCDVYDPATASTTLGLMLVDKYAPTSDPSRYPGRSSLADTYSYIDRNMTLAADILKKVNGTVASMFLTGDAVSALQARIALVKGDYDTAIRLSTALVDSGRYPLIDNEEDFNKLWTNDSGKECMMQLYADYAASSLPSSLSYSYISKAADGTYSPDYILEKWIVDLYAPEDIRFKTWLQKQTLTYGTITGDAYILTKFPGNPLLQDPTKKTSDYINKIKLFRIAEQYLIAAEAYALKTGNDGLASKYLNDLRAKRIPEYTAQDYSGATLLNEIRQERVRELIGEGFRFLDLKRYKTGFTRSAAQNTDIISNAGGSNTEFLSIEPSNFRFLWPIPQAEIDANPQIKNQQNKGY